MRSDYLIVKNIGKKVKYWTGRVWSDRIRNAVLYAEIPPADVLPDDFTRIVKLDGAGSGTLEAGEKCTVDLNRAAAPVQDDRKEEESSPYDE